MVMKRSHKEHSFSRAFEMQHLNNYRKARQQKSYSYNGDKQRIATENTYRRNKPADGKRTRVAHKHARFERVEKQKSDYPARKRNA